jgi:hypothetical protein
MKQWLRVQGIGLAGIEGRAGLSILGAKTPSWLVSPNSCTNLQLGIETKIAPTLLGRKISSKREFLPPKRFNQGERTNTHIHLKISHR